MKVLFGFSLLFFLQFVQSDIVSSYSENLLQLLPKHQDVISEKCSRFYQEQSITELVDASTKFIPSGILNGNFFDFGNFDACYGWNTDFDNEQVYGKYCLATLSLDFNNISIPAQIAICIPSICKAEEVKDLFQDFIDKFTDYIVPLNIDETTCSSKATEPKLSPGAITTISLYSAIGALVLVSTLYEVYIFFYEQKPYHEIFISFSAWGNSSKIWKSTSNSSQLLCLNGLRSISMMWVILGHLFQIKKTLPVTNLLDIQKFGDQNASMYIIGATVSVDTFFTIGGIVTVYTFLNSMDKGVRFNIILYYVHRFLRLTPALGGIILCDIFLVGYLGNGPLWYRVEGTLAETCREHWWTALLYIQNFINPENSCVGQSWYLSVDMQLFLLSPLVLIPLHKYPNITITCIFPFLISLGIVIPGIVAYYYGLTDNLMNLNDTAFMKVYYGQTHARFGPYVIGMLFGYFIYKIKKTGIPFNRKKASLLATISWVMVLGGLYGCVFGVGYSNGSKTSTIFDLAFNRNAWGVIIGLLVTLCVSGYGGIVDKFLSCDIFQKISKISYCMYLVHVTFLVPRHYAWRFPQYFSQKYIWWEFWGDFMMIAFISFIYCIMLESPIVNLEKILLGSGKKKTRTLPE